MAESAAPAAKSWRILVVDDNATNAKLLRAALIPDGHEVSVVTDSTDVVAAVHSSAPDLVLMDVQMPGKDGLTLTRELRADPRTRDVAVVAVSAYARPEDRDRALEAGCDGYVPKPIDTRALPVLLETVMSGAGSGHPATAAEANLR